MGIERLTTQRRLVLGAVKFSSQPITAEAVAAKLQHAPQRVGLATVYRNLKHLTERGAIVRLDGEHGTSYVGHAYHRAVFRCQRCSYTKPLDVARRGLRSIAPGGAKVFASQMTLVGLCPECAKKVSML